MCMSQPSPPKPVAPPEPLKRTDVGAQMARSNYRMKQLAAFGLAGTNRTGGLMGQPVQTAGKSLLGQ